MKKDILILTLVAVASLGGVSAQSPSPTASIVPSRCPQNSASVEVHSFYGIKKTVTEKVTDLPANLSERRVFLQITQSGKTDKPPTDVKLFEQQKDGGFTVTIWTKAEFPGLFDKLDRAIIQNKGESCVGEAMRKVLTDKLGDGKLATPLVAPTSTKDAFGPSVQDASDDFVKTIVIFGC